MSYSESEIDQLCSNSVDGLELVTLRTLRKVARDAGIKGTWFQKKDELCGSIKKTISLKNSEKLLRICDSSIKLLEKSYNPKVHGGDTGETIQQLRKWYSDKMGAIKEIKASRNPSIFDLSSRYSEINSQCKGLTSILAEQMIKKNEEQIRPNKRRKL
jgi:hypothetical protein